MQEEALRAQLQRDEYERHYRQTQAAEARAAMAAQVQRHEESTAGGGAGGYIIIDLPNEKRSLFHDLLKGFEEYARLKGYAVAFSVDSTFQNRIAFKFTLTDEGVTVGTARVRADFKEYLERINSGAPLDDLSAGTSLEEHQVLLTTLKNRISFLQHSYNLQKNAAEFYERLLGNIGRMPMLPAPHVVVQTAGTLTSRHYTAVDSPQALLGDGSQSAASIKIASSFNDVQTQITSIERVLTKLRAEPESVERQEAIRHLQNVKDELEQAPEPDASRIASWLERARQALQTGSLGYETVEAAKTLFGLFGFA